MTILCWLAHTISYNYFTIGGNNSFSDTIYQNNGYVTFVKVCMKMRFLNYGEQDLNGNPLPKDCSFWNLDCTWLYDFDNISNVCAALPPTVKHVKGRHRGYLLMHLHVPLYFVSFLSSITLCKYCSVTLFYIHVQENKKRACYDLI